MQTLLLPAARSSVAPPPPPCMAAVSTISSCSFRQASLRFNCIRGPHSSRSALKWIKGLSSPYLLLTNHSRKILHSAPAAAAAAAAYSSPDDDSEKAKFAQVSKRLGTTSSHFKRLGSFGFCGQLVCTVAAAVIVVLSNVITVTSPATFYATTGGIAAALVSVFWSFCYIQLSDKLQRAAIDPSKAPPRMDLVRWLKHGIVLNLLGVCAAIVGMQATVVGLVAKALPYCQGTSSNPVHALDFFLVQASVNIVLSHFLGLVCSLELLRSVTSPE